jgi:hypothetical protein
VKKFYLFLGLLVGCCQIKAQTIYVKEGHNGTGASWERALGDLQTALRMAKPGMQIWVAAGVYTPAKGNDRNAAFIVPDGVALYGGFAGNETSLQQRNWEVNRTFLSGEIGGPGSEDNSYTVVYTKNVSAATVVNGFFITGGAANGHGEKGDIRRSGAGWYNDGANGRSNPTIENCVFFGNYGRDGAGLYNYAKNGNASPIISNCRFESNRVDLDGGAIYNDGSYGVCNPRIENCMFKDNEANYGAGILNQSTHGETKPLILNCIFISNLSYLRGSSIFNNRQEGGVCDPIIKACRFEENLSSVGPDVSGSSTGNDIMANRRAKSSGVTYRSGY